MEGKQYYQYQCQVQTFEGVADDAKVAMARTEQPGDENAGFSIQEGMHTSDANLELPCERIARQAKLSSTRFLVITESSPAESFDETDYVFFKDVTYKVPVKGDENKYILHGITGLVHPGEQKKERATSVISELGLVRCQNTVIGGTFFRGISGGERKRVCIANEILLNPSLLLLDEPTSGLDSTTALHIVQMLRSIARSGRTVVTTIHQPSSRLFISGGSPRSEGSKVGEDKDHKSLTDRC
ncbi:hypothetical protein V6N12_031365 [Hibiscus sabdariffa]|uniref:ABC transporter domain-containing protein n=1 Tax=Hibiscus sabdariffa TaxID=183260 RepID=A0ABR2EAA3_9ROSI